MAVYRFEFLVVHWYPPSHTQVSFTLVSTVDSIWRWCLFKNETKTKCICNASANCRNMISHVDLRVIELVLKNVEMFLQTCIGTAFNVCFCDEIVINHYLDDCVAEGVSVSVHPISGCHWSVGWVHGSYPGATEWQFACVWSVVQSSGDGAEASGSGSSSTSVNHPAHEWRAMKSIKPNLAPGRAEQNAMNAQPFVSNWWMFPNIQMCPLSDFLLLLVSFGNWSRNFQALLVYIIKSLYF